MTDTHAPARPDMADPDLLLRPQILAAGLVWLGLIGGGLAVALAALWQAGFLPGAEGLRAAALALALYLTGVGLVLAGLRRAGGGMAAFGGCNRVTTLRMGMAAMLGGAMAAPGLVAPAGALAWPALAVAVAALVLDGLDGWMARRSGQSSDFGARFDMEVDAATIMILATLAWQTGQAPVWVLALGLMRYAFVLGGLRWAFLRADLPPSFRRKVVCVVQVAVLAALLAPVIVPPLSTLLAALALLALTWSFGVDVRWQWRQGRE